MNDLELNLMSKIQYELHEPLNINLPYKIDLVFESIRKEYEGKLGRFKEIENRENQRRNNVNYFYNLIQTGVKNSLGATFYNLSSFKQLCSFIRDKATDLLQGYHSKQPQVIGFSAQKLVVEYEHFTLHSRIVLDRLNWFLNYYFNTDSRNLYRLYNTLDKNTINNELGKKIMQTIDKHRQFLDELISLNKTERRTERDHLAHREEIQFTFINIRIMPDGKISVIPLSKNKPFEKEADSDLAERFQGLSNFTEDILHVFFGFSKE